jgi:predicted GNAT family acetyltransferase
VGGRGIASLLTTRAVKCAESKGWKVEPACAYADTWFKRNTEYKHLLA